MSSWAEISGVRLPVALVGTSPFVGAGQFGPRALALHARFFGRPGAVAEVLEAAVEAGAGGVQALSYPFIVEAIRRKDRRRFLMTIEVDPRYGKYHWSGHRQCGVALPPEEALKLGNKCPVCGKPLTKGVEQRVEELADRPPGFRPEGAIDFIHLLPLSEIIASVIGARGPDEPEVWRIYDALVARFGGELSVLLDARRDEIEPVAGPLVAEAILRVREGCVKITPGYDGVYGQVELFEEGPPSPRKPAGGQMSLLDFM